MFQINNNKKTSQVTIIFKRYVLTNLILKRHKAERFYYD